MTAPAPIPRLRHTPTSQHHWLTHTTPTTQPPPAQAAQPTSTPTPTDQAHPSTPESPHQGSTCPCDSCPHCCCTDSDNNTQQAQVSNHA
jgi:hypothetical protein